MEAALKAMSDPTRREILRLVQNEEKPAGEIASNFPVSRPAISQHLTVLKTAGLVDERRSGVKRLYRTRVAGMTELREFLEQFWDDRLERLKAVVEAAESTSGDSEENSDDNARS